MTSEVIHILASEKELERVPFIVLPNIVADLPVYLIWGEDPTRATKILEALQSFATRLIFNAAFADHIQEFSQRMLGFLSTVKVEVMDISWGSLSSYRNLLAEVFNSQEKIEFLRSPRKIIIRYSGNGAKDNLAAIYLQAFLASSLGWKLAAEEIHHEHQKALCYTYQNQDINVILEEDTVTIASKGSLTQFEVTGKDGTSYSLYSSKNGSKVVLHISSLESCELPCTFALPDLNRGLNFLKEIFYQTPSKSYNQALEIIAKVNWEK
ncbi:MAG TPA: glucose-6-phosphate dehydrogenase assembly protein OpcA [Parachlamydiaceae bacterium]|nr:glucose-6-phosphate dehydrogenase assembly protein OpcA [Parachlamydiaceae bacterium]